MIQRPAAPAVACREAVSGLENSSVASFPCLETGRGQFATYYIPLFAKFYPSLHSMAARLQKQMFSGFSNYAKLYFSYHVALCASNTGAKLESTFVRCARIASPTLHFWRSGGHGCELSSLRPPGWRWIPS